jgi:hypothetical protein
LNKSGHFLDQTLHDVITKSILIGSGLVSLCGMRVLQNRFFSGAQRIPARCRCCSRPDHDNAGWEHINKVGSELTGITKRIRVLVLPHVRAKDDVIDWARNGGTREQLDALLGEAQDWKPPSVDEINKTEGGQKGQSQGRRGRADRGAGQNEPRHRIRSRT